MSFYQWMPVSIWWYFSVLLWNPLCLLHVSWPSWLGNKLVWCQYWIHVKYHSYIANVPNYLLKHILQNIIRLLWLYMSLNRHNVVLFLSSDQLNLRSYRWPRQILQSYGLTRFYKFLRQKCRIYKFLRQKCRIYKFLR